MRKKESQIIKRIRLLFMPRLDWLARDLQETILYEFLAKKSSDSAVIREAIDSINKYNQRHIFHRRDYISDGFLWLKLDLNEASVKSIYNQLPLRKGSSVLHDMCSYFLPTPFS